MGQAFNNGLCIRLTELKVNSSPCYEYWNGLIYHGGVHMCRMLAENEARCMYMKFQNLLLIAVVFPISFLPEFLICYFATPVRLPIPWQVWKKKCLKRCKIHPWALADVFLSIGLCFNQLYPAVFPNWTWLSCSHLIFPLVSSRLFPSCIIGLGVP